MAVSELAAAAGIGGGEFKWPPGFRFHPTDEELVVYYLKRKICRKRLRLNVIRELDVYKWDPEDLPGLALLKTGDRQWFFFSPRDHKYPNGGRASRATAQGYWKATGKDRTITCNSRNVGGKKTLIFYRGRAPTGDRTDWVMHEYTLDEEELKRCPNVQDYYALYKVFKKSGPGPKNGEQYGAPFREEDWLDDETATVRVPEVPVSNEKVVCRVEPPSDNLFDLIKEIVQEPRHEGLPPTHQVDGAETAEGTLLASRGNSQAMSNFKNPNVSEVNCGAKWTVDDFLEVEDLLGPEPTESNAGDPLMTVDSLFDGLDRYQDAAMFVRDMGPLGQGYLQSAVNQVNHEPSEFDYFWQPESYNGGCIDNDQSNITASNRGANLQQNSGVICDSIDHNSVANGNQAGSTTSGWFSSGLWSFVDSIPYEPASAAESPLVNKAMGRMTSFRRLRTNLTDANNVPATRANVRRAGGNNGVAMLLLSVMGVLLAILWVCI